MSRARRQTDLEWLTAVPAEWDEREIGRDVWVRARLGWKGLTADEYVDEGVPMLATPDIKSPEIQFASAKKITKERYTESPDIMLAEGDVLLTKDGSTIGTVNVVRELPSAATVNGSIAVLTPTGDLDGRYLYWFIASSYAQSIFGRLRGGMGVPHLFQRDINRIKMPHPGRAEQQAIADYLDRETARIDTLIEEQQRLVEMLRERREVEIRHTLLAGVDEAPTKSSGVALLGEIPRHWHMVPARYLCTITTGSEDSGNASEDGQYPFYVRGREILSIDRYSFDGEAVMTPGDGQGGTGKVFHYFDGKFEAHQRVYVFKDFDGVTGPFFYYFLSTFLRPVALAGSNTVTMESLRRPLLADFKVAVPPIDEQRRITEYLDEQTAKLDELVAETERFIELSRERRAALITAAVTGQIDVREAA